jgi:hypothetical protein
MNRRLLCAALLWLTPVAFSVAQRDSGIGSEWLRTLTTNKPIGKFPGLPAMRTKYRFGWSGFNAASAQVNFAYNNDQFTLDASGGTAGFARALYPLDVDHHAVGSRTTLRASHVYQTERYRSETVQTSIDFKPEEVTSLRKTIPEKEPPKLQRFDAAPAYDLMSALLWLRSQPLNNGDVETLVAYPSNAPYLATITVAGREKININGVEHNAIRLNLSLRAIDKHLRLKPYKKLKSARGWISDDTLRIPLRIEGDIFIGYVFAEIEG